MASGLPGGSFDHGLSGSAPELGTEPAPFVHGQQSRMVPRMALGRQAPGFYGIGEHDRRPVSYTVSLREGIY